MATIEAGAKRYRSRPDGLENAERLANKGAAFARHIATFGQPVYAEAWAKHMTNRDYLLEGAEARALAVGTATSAGSLVPTHLDPSIMLSNAGSYNPWRQISRVVELASPGPNSWNGVSSAGVTASWDAEAAEVSDDAPATVQYAIPTHKGQAYVEASYETIEDVAGLAGEIVTLFADAKNRLEATAFATGSGSAQPTGIEDGLDANAFVEVSNTTGSTLGLVDLHAALNGLSARFRDRATWAMSPDFLGVIQQLGTAVSASFSTDVTQNYTNQLLGRPVVLSSDLPTGYGFTTTINNLLIVGDFNNFVIVDKIGVRTVFNPVALSDTTTRPSGSAGWLMHWRVGSEPVYTGDATTTRAFVLLQDATTA